MVNHLQEDVLMAYLDGELKTAQSEQVRFHVESCWTCRARLRQVESAISAVVDYQNAWLETPEAAPPKGWREFDLRLQELVARSTPPPRFKRWMVWTAAAAALAAFAVWFRLDHAPAVSAAEVIRHAVEAEKKVPGPVVYHKVMLRRQRRSGGERSGSMRLWNDTRVGHTSADGDRALWDELEHVLAQNHVSPAAPLSAEAYRAWRAAAGAVRDKVVETSTAQGAPALAVSSERTAPSTSGEIVGSELVVRAADWHPVRQVWNVEQSGEVMKYELTELEYAAGAESSLPAQAQAEAVPAPVPTATAPSAPAQPVTPPVDPEAAEVEVHYRLHRAGACLNGTVHVTREGTSIAVRGITQGQRQQSELAASLGQIASVVVSIQAAGDDPQPVSFDALAPDAAGASALARSNAAILLAHALRREGWALRRLADRYGTATGALDQHSRRLVETMIRDHVEQLDRLLSRYGPGLRRTLGPDEPAPAPPISPVAWDVAARAVSLSAETLDQLVQAIFTSQADGVQTREALRALANLQSELDALRRSLAPAFPR